MATIKEHNLKIVLNTLSSYTKIDIETIVLQTKLTDLKLTYYDVLEWLLDLEDELCVNLPLESFAFTDSSTIEDVISFINKHHS